MPFAFYEYVILKAILDPENAKCQFPDPKSTISLDPENVKYHFPDPVQGINLDPESDIY